MKITGQEAIEIPLSEIGIFKDRQGLITSTYSFRKEEGGLFLDGSLFEVGVYSGKRFVPGIMASSINRFLPGRILVDNQHAPSFFPGIDLETHFVPGVVLGTRFVPGVYYCRKFIPGVYRDNRFIIGQITPNGFEEIPDSSDLADLLFYGNPLNWDLSEAYTRIDEQPDLSGRQKGDPQEATRDHIISKFLLPVGYGNGSKPMDKYEGITLPGHDEPLSWERGRAMYELLDIDKDGLPELGMRIKDPRAQPVVGEETGEFFIMPTGGGEDLELLGSSVGIGSGSSGGGWHDVRGGIEGALGGISQRGPGKIKLGDPGPGDATGAATLEFVLVALVITVIVIVLIESFRPPAPPEPD